MSSYQPILKVLVRLALAATAAFPSVGTAQSPSAKPPDATSPDACAALGDKVAAANPATPLTLQLVKTHFARTTGRCYVLLTIINDAGNSAPVNNRILYNAKSQQVLAVANDQSGSTSGMVFDIDHRAFSTMNNGYDDALGYIDSKMSFD